MITARRTTGPRSDAEIVERAERRGLAASIGAVPLAGTVCLAWLVVDVAYGSALPAGTVSLVATVPLAIAGQAVVAESRRPEISRRRAMPDMVRNMCLTVPVVGLIPALISFFAMRIAVISPACRSLDIDEERPCVHDAASEALGLAAWIGVLGVVAVLLIGCVLLARRSRTAVFAAYPLVVSGCVIAVDVADLAAGIVHAR